MELDARIGHIMDKLRELGLDKNTLVFYTTDNGAWQDVYPDAGYTPFRGTKGHGARGGQPRAGDRCVARQDQGRRAEPRHRRRPRPDGHLRFRGGHRNCRRRIAKASRSSSTATTCRPCCFGTGKCARNAWFYFTENELTPGAARVGNYKAVFNLRGDDGQATGGLAVDSNLGWKGAEKYVATVPQVFDLWQDPQERYDIFMNNYTERTWTMVTFNEAIKELMKTYIKYPPRKLQSEVYTGPITLSRVSALPERAGAVEEGGHRTPAAYGQLITARL